MFSIYGTRKENPKDEIFLQKCDNFEEAENLLNLMKDIYNDKKEEVSVSVDTIIIKSKGLGGEEIISTHELARKGPIIIIAE